MKNVVNKLKGKKEIIYKISLLLLAIISYSSLCLSGIIEVYSIESWIIFICLLFYFFKTKIYDKKYFKSTIIFTLIFTFFTIFGKIVLENQKNADVNVFIELLSIKALIHFIGMFILIYSVLIKIIPFLIEFKINKNKTISNKKIFIICFVGIMLLWIPYFLSLFPGCLTPDSIGCIGWSFDNTRVLSDANPILYQIFLKVTFNIGNIFFDSANANVAVTTFFQMMIMSSIFSYSIVFLNKKNLNFKYLIFVFLFYALLPVHAIYSTTMWKDVLFAGFVLLLTIELYKIYELDGNISIRNQISFFIISLITIFLRNNGIYMYFILVIFLFLLYKKAWKKLIPVGLIVISLFYIIKGPIFSHFDIQKSASAEYIAMPLQQIGRMAYKDVEFTDKEKDLINKLIPIEVLRRVYNPVVVDTIKFNPNYYGSNFDKNKIEYLKLWVSLVFKHPSIALEAYANSTLGYWYPNVEYWATYKDVYKNDYNIYRESKAGSLVDFYVEHIESRKLPLLNSQYSIGLVIWMIIIFTYIAFKKKDKKVLLPYIPIYGIWLTMLIASPVYAEFRYVYSAYTCLPFLLLIPFLKDRREKND